VVRNVEYISTFELRSRIAEVRSKLHDAIVGKDDAKLSQRSDASHRTRATHRKRRSGRSTSSGQLVYLVERVALEED
jgi:hypothetical protein